MALATSSLTLFVLNLFFFLHFPSPTFSHRPLPVAHPTARAPPGNPIVEQICHHTRDPIFCKNLANGDVSSIRKVDDNSGTVRIFNALHDIATISKDHISQDVKCTNVKVQLKGALGKCLTSYTQAVTSLTCSSPAPDAIFMDRSFRNADQSLWDCREVVEKLANDLPIAYVKAANHLMHYFISFGTTRTSFKLHPNNPKPSENWS